jgi:hypothetical protein
MAAGPLEMVWWAACMDDIYTKHPWVLSALYNGNVYIWDYSTNVSISYQLTQETT